VRSIGRILRIRNSKRRRSSVSAGIEPSELIEIRWIKQLPRLSSKLMPVPVVVYSDVVLLAVDVNIVGC
jgi:hypothetical protein